MKYLAALSTIAIFLTAGWVIITGDGIRWFFLSVLCLFAAITGMILVAAKKEYERREQKQKERDLQLQQAQKNLDEAVKRMAKNN